MTIFVTIEKSGAVMTVSRGALSKLVRDGWAVKDQPAPKIVQGKVPSKTARKTARKATRRTKKES